MRALSDFEYRFRDAQEMAQALRDVLECAASPALITPVPLAVPAATVAPTLPAAAAATVATLPAQGLAADAAPPASTTSPTAESSLAAPSSPSPASLPTPPPSPLGASTTVQLAAAAPSAVLTRKGLSAMLSIAFASGSAAGATAVHVATTGGVDTGTFEGRLALDDDIATLPSRHVPLVAPSRPTATPVPPEPTTSPTNPRRALRSSAPSPQVSRARKGILACNPPKAQLTATVLIDRRADGEPRVRFNGHEILGVFGDCALQVAQMLSLHADQPLRFKL